MRCWNILQEPFRPLIRRDFRRLWLASTVTLFGFWVHRVAASWLMTSLSKSPSLIALMESFYFLPTLIVSIPAGIVADCVNRARYLLIVLAAMFVVQVATAFLVGSGMASTLLLSLVLLLTAAAAGCNPALDAELSRAVPPEDLKQAVALDGVSFNLARIAGPAVGGAVLAFGLMLPFAVTALSTIPLFVVFMTWKGAARPTRSLAEISHAALGGLTAILSTRLMAIWMSGDLPPCSCGDMSVPAIDRAPAIAPRRRGLRFALYKFRSGRGCRRPVVRCHGPSCSEQSRRQLRIAGLCLDAAGARAFQ